MTDTKLLRDHIEASGMKYVHIAKKLGLSAYGLQRKIENDSEFKASEIVKLCEVLNLDIKARDNIFFAA
jgi:DNA-binding phage protein